MKKTVANRRMFRQGGAVNSGPTGILASSPSLIDAVAQDAMNVQGGPTVRMADGGIVRRMANGGFIGPSQNPAALPAFLNPPPLRALPSPVTAVEATMKPRSERLSGEELLNLSLGARTILPPEIAEPIFEYPASPVGSQRSSLPPSSIMRKNLEEDADRITMERLTTEYVQGDPDGVVREYLQSIAGTPAYGKIFSALQDAEMQMGQSGSQEIPTISDPTKFGDFERQEVDTEMGTSDVIGPREDVSPPNVVPAEEETAVTKTPATAPEADPNIAAEIDALGEGQEEKIVSNIESKGQSAAVTSEEVDTPDNSFDLDKSIDEFVSKMPKPEGNEQTSGLKLLLLGASIFKGESPNAWKNVGDGLEKVLPSIIKDKEDEEKFLRNIRVAGAKYALTKRDKIEQEERTAKRARNSYFLDEEVVLRDDNGKVTKKFAAGWNRLNEKDFQQVKGITGSNLVPEQVFIDAAKAKADNLKELIKARAANTGYDKKTNTYKARLNDQFGDVELQVRYPDAKNPRAKPILLTPEKLVSHYEEAIGRNGALMSLADTASSLLNKADENITGFDGIIGQGQDIYRAYFEDPSKNPYFKAGDETSEGLVASSKGEISDTNRYNTTLRFLAIQMAPMLLGESGKTISDGDRTLVASALGLTKQDDGNWQWVQSSAISKGQLQERLKLIKDTLARNRKSIDNGYRRTWREFGIEPTREAQPSVPSSGSSRLSQRKDKDGRTVFFFAGSEGKT